MCNHTETGTYYLRARYYDPRIGRFTQQDTHWNTSNRIYGDNPQKINEREDALGLKTYSYAPQISAVVQSGNLYVYAVGNPVMYADEDGEFALITAKLLAAAGHGLFNGIAKYIEYKDTGKNALVGFAFGFFSGAVSSFVGDSVPGKIISTVVFSVAEAIADYFINNNKRDLEEFNDSIKLGLINGLLSCTTNKLFDTIGDFMFNKKYVCVSLYGYIVKVKDLEYLKTFFGDLYSQITDNEVSKEVDKIFKEDD